MTPVVVPPLAETCATALKNTRPLQLEKSIVTVAEPVACDAMFPADAGKLLVIDGVHGVPNVCVNVRLSTSAPIAVPLVPLPILTVHWRALRAPVFAPKLPPSDPVTTVSVALALLPVPPFEEVMAPVTFV